MTDPTIETDREDDSRGIRILSAVALLIGLLIVVNLTQTAGDIFHYFTGDRATEQAAARSSTDFRPDSIAVATRTVHYDCSTARPSLATWVGGYVDRLLPGGDSEANRIRNCTRCGKPLERAPRRGR